MARVLLTGASGYIGRALEGRLHMAGHTVVRGSRRVSAAVHVRLDLERDPPVAVADLAGLDAVVHLAGLAHAGPGREAAAERINAVGTGNLAAQAAAAGIPHFIFVSSVQVHGRRDPGRPLTEAAAYAPADGYARSKMRAEQALLARAERSGLSVTIVRPPAVYGPGAPGNLARLAAWAAHGRPLPAATCQARRSLIALPNLCDLLGRLVARGPAGVETFLVRDGTDLSVGGLYSALCRAQGLRPRFVPGSRRWLAGMLRLSGRGATADGLFGDLRIDDTRLRRSLGWTAPVPLEVALAEFALGRAIADDPTDAPEAAGVPEA